MNKFDLATKICGFTVVALIFMGIFNMPLMDTLAPFILIGTAVTLGLYILTAFKTKNYGRMTAILILAAFVIAIIGYNKFM